jgi:N-acetylglucosamine malate deacetylase 2
MNHSGFGRTMLIMAHPDDETGGAGFLLQRLTDAMVVFCTDGAPNEPWFWRGCESREAYAAIRRSEALEALSIAGVKGVSFLSNSRPTDFRDQQLHTVLSTAIEMLDRLVRWYVPDSIITTAYEGGHPDHDSCSFICAEVGRRNRVQVYEIPLYHRDDDGRICYQQFGDTTGAEFVIRPSEREVLAKEEMVKRYKSQSDLDLFTASTVEYYRLQKAYDFTRPPSKVINYESWGWPVSAAELCGHFNEYYAMQVESRSTALDEQIHSGAV